MSVMVRENWGVALLPILRRVFNRQLDTHQDYVKTIYNVEKSTKAVEQNQAVGNLGLMDDWEQSRRRVSYEGIALGHRSTYVNRKYSKGLEIERELLDDDQIGEIRKRVRALADTVAYTRQWWGAELFNDAFDGNRFKGPDGVPLCATNHTVSPESSVTYSNVKEDFDLTPDNVEALRTEMMQWTDDKGNLLVMNPDTLIVPPALRKAALVIADSDKEPFTQLNNVNIWRGSLDVIEWPFLKNPKAWFMVDSRRMKNMLNWYDRRKPTIVSSNDFDTEVAKYAAIGRWSLGWDDASFLVGAIEKA